MTKDKALRRALEALCKMIPCDDVCSCSGQQAITAIKEALAQPEQEPVAWMYDWICDGQLVTGWIAHNESEIPKTVASNIRPLYTTPPKREWVGLTDVEMHECAGEYPWTPTGLRCCRAIEAKLKEKNT